MDTVSVAYNPMNNRITFINKILALKLHLETLTSEKLFKAIHAVIHDSKYRRAAK